VKVGLSHDAEGGKVSLYWQGGEVAWGNGRGRRPRKEEKKQSASYSLERREESAKSPSRQKCDAFSGRSLTWAEGCVRGKKFKVYILQRGGGVVRAFLGRGGEMKGKKGN